MLICMKVCVWGGAAVCPMELLSGSSCCCVPAGSPNQALLGLWSRKKAVI
jgi:hypothetical protein